MNLEQLRKLVDSTPLFKLDKEKDWALYQQEKTKLIDALYRYDLTISKKDYNLEIMETVEEVLKYYKPDQGDFLHYFNRALKGKKKVANGEEYNSNRDVGVSHVYTQNQKNLVKAIVKYAQSKGKNPQDEEVLKSVSEITGVSMETLLIAMEAVLKRPIQNTIVRNSEGKEQDTIVNIASDYSEQEMAVNCDNTVDGLSKTFSELQNREGLRNRISTVLTVNALFILKPEEFKKYFVNKIYFNKEAYEHYKNYEDKPSGKDLSEYLGVNPAQLSRDMKVFREKIKIN